MILYHYTDLWFLQNGGTILQEGLKPSDRLKDDDPLFWPVGCVWLTTEADPIWWWDNGKKSELRIKVAIPATDRRLVRWPKWQAEHWPPALVEARQADMSSTECSTENTAWHLYFGRVPLSKFRAVEYADPARREAAREELRVATCTAEAEAAA